MEKRPPHIVKGTAVFLTSDPAFVPTAMLHNLKHNKVLHEHNVILTIETAHTPRVDSSERVRMEKISDKFSKVKLRFGFMESPNVPKALAIARKLGWQFDIPCRPHFSCPGARCGGCVRSRSCDLAVIQQLSCAFPPQNFAWLTRVATVIHSALSSCGTSSFARCQG